MSFTIAVVGPAQASPDEAGCRAQQVGHHLAAAGHTVLTGGSGRVMQAAYVARRSLTDCRRHPPGMHRSQANPFVTVAIPTGLGEMRNALIVRSAETP